MVQNIFTTYYPVSLGICSLLQNRPTDGSRYYQTGANTTTSTHYHLRLVLRALTFILGHFQIQHKFNAICVPFGPLVCGPTARLAASEGHAGLPGLPAPGTPLELLFSIGS